MFLRGNKIRNYSILLLRVPCLFQDSLYETVLCIYGFVYRLLNGGSKITKVIWFSNFILSQFLSLMLMLLLMTDNRVTLRLMGQLAHINNGKSQTDVKFVYSYLFRSFGYIIYLAKGKLQRTSICGVEQNVRIDD